MVPERSMEGNNRQHQQRVMRRSGSTGSAGENGSDSDSEHYHILSYFMGGEAGASGSHGNGGFVTASGAPGRMLKGKRNSGSSSSLNTAEPPPTPAVQFYGHHSLSQSGAAATQSGGTSPGMSSALAPPLTASSSSSSLSSMAAALVSGGPVAHTLFQKQRKDSPLSPSMMHTSPISPAAVIGPGQENLMLPPPPRFPKNSGATNPATASQTTEMHPVHDPERKQLHMAWLQHLNSMAMRANPQQQPHGMQPPPQFSNAPVMPGYHAPAAAPVMPPPQQHSPAASAGAPLAPSPVFSLQGPGTTTSMQPSPMGESEERRARRLKRNRESARQSRRRKKEHLAKLEKKVNGLHTAIETERQGQTLTMEPSLNQVRQELISMGREEKLPFLVKEMSPNCAVRRAVVSFQYPALKQLLLPKYQEFLLWLTLHPETYFLAGKEKKIKSAAAEQTTRVSSGRVSSKQIGEEISNEFKKGAKKNKGQETSGSNSPTPGEGKGYITAKAFDAAEMWPLLCYELSVSVDQEERLLQAQKKIRQLANLPNDRSQMAVATRMASNLRNGVLYQAHTADHRSQSALLHILTPQQSLKFLQWFAANRDRCLAVLQKKRQQKAVAVKEEEDSDSLSEVCRKLERVLRIPENEFSI